MEIPKNVTQIGELNEFCRVYIEDYVISFLKQMNAVAKDKHMALALYGRREEEEGKTFLFLYGAAKVNYIQKEVRHLSQAQKQEIQWNLQKYFPMHTFQGYALLNGEAVEGFYILEKEVCRFVGGYAQFYEKNDEMLAYMLEERQKEATPEVVNREKYDTVRQRQQERRKDFFGEEVDPEEEEIKASEGKHSGFRYTAIASLGVLCMLGVMVATGPYGLQKDSNGQEDMQTESLQVVQGKAEGETVIKPGELLSEALEQENQAQIDLQEQIVGEQSESAPEATEESTVQESVAEEGNATENTGESIEESLEAANKAEPVWYEICKGDTLNAISLRNYGDRQHIQAICDLNQITNPDRIKIGQKILLPIP